MKRALTLIFLATLIGCDSNSGAIAPGGQPPPPPPGTGITSANAVAISGTTWEAVNNSAAVVGLVGNSGLVASGPGGVNKAAQDLVAKGSTGNIVQGIPVDTTIDCVIPGGTARVFGEIADPFTPTLTPDDMINVDYNNCDDDIGEVLDGLLEMTIVSFAGDMLLGPYDLTADLTLTNFQVTTAADSILTTGMARVSLNSLDPMNVSASVSGSSMTTDTNSFSETLTNFQSAQTLDAIDQALPFTISASGTLDNSLLSGVISYQTGPSFAGFGLDYPSSGVLVINGTGSSARLTANDNVNVTIDIDNDGDGMYDEMIMTTWAELTTAPMP
jgi:hypothetical protein